MFQPLVRRSSDRKIFADRLDFQDLVMLVDEGNHHFCRRSSSALAKYADAKQRISFALQSSRFSRSSWTIRYLSLSSEFESAVVRFFRSSFTSVAVTQHTIQSLWQWSRSRAIVFNTQTGAPQAFGLLVAVLREKTDSSFPWPYPLTKFALRQIQGDSWLNWINELFSSLLTSP